MLTQRAGVEWPGASSLQDWPAGSGQLLWEAQLGCFVNIDEAIPNFLCKTEDLDQMKQIEKGK